MDVMREAAAQAGSRARTQGRTRKSAATLEKIMAAASELMVERGGMEFQMSEVSERCSMSKGALYYYFSDRTALVHAVLDRAVDDLVRSIEAMVADAPTAMGAIRGVMETMAGAMRPDTPLSLAVTSRSAGEDPSALPDVEGRVLRIVAILAAQLERAKGEGIVRQDVDTTLASLSIVGTLALLGCRTAYNAFGREGTAVEEVLSLSFGGIGTEGALALVAADTAAQEGH